MKNTPKYWQKAKYEILAKLDNFGPFNVFFTLSCADLRWEANFAAILQDRGIELNYTCFEEDGKWSYIIEARTSSGAWKPIEKFLEEDMEESKHELIRGNVVTATRYCHQRVKSFMSKIVMAKSNPMSVKYYTWRAEFQERGALHVHGTIWVNTRKLEMLKEVNGRLCVKNAPGKGPSCEPNWTAAKP